MLARLYSDSAKAQVSTCLVTYIAIGMEGRVRIYAVLNISKYCLSNYIIDKHIHSYTDMPCVVVITMCKIEILVATK